MIGGHRSARTRRMLVAAAAVLLALTLLAAVALAASTNFVEPPSSPESAGDLPISIGRADLDGDGDADIAVANGISNNVTILKNNGRGNFVEPASSPETAGAQPIEIVVADLDDDTDPDLAVANEGSNNVTILKNNGTGNYFQPASSPEPAGDDPHSLTAGDLDGDSDLDLAVTNQNSDDVTILKNNGTGAYFQPASSPEDAGDGPAGVSAADFDGDTDLDLAVSNSFSNNVTVLRNNGSGNFVEPPTSPEASDFTPRGNVAADLDGDGDPDLATANAVGSVTILRNVGSADFTEPAASPEDAGGGPFSLAAADFDGDTDQDLAVANGTSDDVSILRNNGSGNFGAPATSPEAAGDFAHSVVAADFDADLDPDLAVANAADDTVTILRNR